VCDREITRIRLSSTALFAILLARGSALAGNTEHLTSGIDNFKVVPEPSAALLPSLGLGVLARHREK